MLEEKNPKSENSKKTETQSRLKWSINFTNNSDVGYPDDESSENPDK